MSKPDNKTPFGLRIKKYRETFKITQKEMAIRIGITQAALSRIENLKCTPHENTVLMAELTGVQ